MCKMRVCMYVNDQYGFLCIWILVIKKMHVFFYKDNFSINFHNRFFCYLLYFFFFYHVKSWFVIRVCEKYSSQSVTEYILYTVRIYWSIIYLTCWQGKRRESLRARLFVPSSNQQEWHELKELNLQYLPLFPSLQYSQK
jgi:hypothetical protein